jgi:hypothetical protein
VTAFRAAEREGVGALPREEETAAGSWAIAGARGESAATSCQRTERKNRGASAGAAASVTTASRLERGSAGAGLRVRGVWQRRPVTASGMSRAGFGWQSFEPPGESPGFCARGAMSRAYIGARRQ